MLKQIFFSLALFQVSLSSIQAASLQVSPITLNVLAPNQATAINLNNTGTASLNAQIRVFRWQQVDGKEQLEPTETVVASPPTISVPPNANYTVRIVRLDNTPIATEESYRLFIDELPDANREANGAISLIVRYSVPVFFTSPDTPRPQTNWSFGHNGGRAVLTVQNNGGKRLRLSQLKLSAGGKTISWGPGLAGYVLAGSTMQFPFPKGQGLSASTAKVSVMTDQGPLDATAPAH